MIIDAHSHLGDILYQGGGNLIYQTGAPTQPPGDPQALNEKLLMRTFGLGKILYRLLLTSATKGQRARNQTATLENLSRSLDDAGVGYTVCLPIAPYVTFADLAEAARIEKRIIPFTSVDFTKDHNIAKQLADDVAQGAQGLKLHPIIQCTSLSDVRTLEAVAAFSDFKKPVLVHAGRSNYYLGNEKNRQKPEYADIVHIEKLVRDFPSVNFVVGHAGLFWQDQTRKYLKGLSNVWVDTSFQSPGNIRKLIATFGPEKVLYASDWPWGFRPPHIKAVRTACRGDRSLEERVFYRNAADLLGLEG